MANENDKSVADMAAEVLARQAKARAARTGESFEDALKAVLRTQAGRQLEELRIGLHRRERAEEWQANVARKRAEERAEELGWSSPRESSGPSADG